jgi:hypothetical protein
MVDLGDADLHLLEHPERSCQGVAPLGLPAHLLQAHVGDLEVQQCGERSGPRRATEGDCSPSSRAPSVDASTTFAAGRRLTNCTSRRRCAIRKISMLCARPRGVHRSHCRPATRHQNGYYVSLNCSLVYESVHDERRPDAGPARAARNRPASTRRDGGATGVVQRMAGKGDVRAVIESLTKVVEALGRAGVGLIGRGVRLEVPS